MTIKHKLISVLNNQKNYWILTVMVILLVSVLEEHKPEKMPYRNLHGCAGF